MVKDPQLSIQLWWVDKKQIVGRENDYSDFAGFATDF